MVQITDRCGRFHHLADAQLVEQLTEEDTTYIY
jgi:hypothetical protein